MTLIQGAGVDWPGPRTVTYSRPSRAKPPSPLKNSRSGARARPGALKRDAIGLRRRFRGRGRLQNALELLEQPAALRGKSDPRNRGEKALRFGCDQVRAQQKDAARPVLRSRQRRRLVCPRQRLDRDLKFLDIRGLTIVQDDQIDGELFHAPIFVRLQKLSHDVDVFDVRDAQKNDRQIPGNALRPQARLRAAAPQNRIRRGTHGRRGVNHMSGESLKQARFARGHAKMVQLHLTLRPGERRGARERGSVAMFVDAVEKRFARGRRRLSSRRREPSRPAQRECAGGWRKSGRGRRRSSLRAAGYP